MPQLTITVHERPYQVVCEEGQEQHVEKLAAYIDQRVRELASRSGMPGPAGQITEARLLVMAALLIADELGESYDEIEELRQAPPRMVADPASLKAAEDARSVASAARLQLGEAETAARAAMTRAAEAEAARAQLEQALRDAEARAHALEQQARSAQAAATQAEAALHAAARRIEESEVGLRQADVDRETMRATLASLSAQSTGARAGDEALAAGLEGLAQQIENMATRVERSAAR